MHMCGRYTNPILLQIKLKQLTIDGIKWVNFNYTTSLKYRLGILVVHLNTQIFAKGVPEAKQLYLLRWWMTCRSLQVCHFQQPRSFYWSPQLCHTPGKVDTSHHSWQVIDLISYMIEFWKRKNGTEALEKVKKQMLIW